MTLILLEEGTTGERSQKELTIATSQCTTERPQCRECRKRRTICNYTSYAPSTATATTPAQQVQKPSHGQMQVNNDFERVFRLLQSQPDHVATEMLCRIRQGTTMPDILRHAQYGDLRLQLSLVPDTSYQFAPPYLADMLPLFENPDNAYLNSTLYKYLMAPSPTMQQSQSNEPPHGGAAYRIPYAGARMYDARLSSVTLQPSKWTAIAKDDNLLLALLEIYFLYEFPFWPCFHKDLFLDNMITGQGEFCTPLLVNAVLTAACVSGPSPAESVFTDSTSMDLMCCASEPSFGTLEPTATCS